MKKVAFFTPELLHPQMKYLDRVIFTEKLINKLLSRDGDQLIKVMQHLVNQDMVMIFFCKDVSKFCSGPLLDGRVSFKHICVFNPYKGQIISHRDVKYAFKKLAEPVEEIIMVSTNEKDLAFAKKFGIDFILYTTNFSRHKNLPHSVIKSITSLLSIV